MKTADIKIVLIHGNGGGTGQDYWFPSLQKTLEQQGLHVIANTFPDAEVAHEAIWIPYLEKEIQADEITVLVGHSSGGIASIRYAEHHTILGSVLVGVNYTDLGDATEKESGYYNHPWDWNAIKKNQQWILQFSSTDDPYIPIDQPRFIHEQLQSDYHEYSDKGHFMIPEFPELGEILLAKIRLAIT